MPYQVGSTHPQAIRDEIAQLERRLQEAKARLNDEEDAAVQAIPARTAPSILRSVAAGNERANILMPRQILTRIRSI